MEHYDEEPRRSRLIGPDIADEFDSLFTVEEDNMPEWQPHWDPTTFASTHFGLKIADWKFSEDRLREFAILSAEIRAAINEKATIFDGLDEVQA